MSLKKDQVNIGVMVREDGTKYKLLTKVFLRSESCKVYRLNLAVM